MSSKRKLYFKALDDDGKPESLLSACLQIDPNVELKEVPTTGDEFLLKVMTERRQCELVTKCNKDIMKYSKNQSCFYKELPMTKSAPEALKPSMEWQNVQVADFSEVRMYVSRWQAKKSSWPKTVKKIMLNDDCVVWKEFFNKNTPSLSLMFGVSLNQLHNGLAILVQTLNKVKQGETISQKTGQWIYSYLACIPLPLQSETISVLRDLARKCSEIRSHINVESEDAIAKVAPLNIFICLVARYFRQFDLAD